MANRKVKVNQNVTIMINEEPRVLGSEFSVDNETYERIKEYVDVTGEGDIVDAEIVEDVNPDDMTVDQIKKSLDDLKVEYKKSANKDELLGILKDNLKE